MIIGAGRGGTSSSPAPREAGAYPTIAPLDLYPDPFSVYTSAMIYSLIAIICTAGSGALRSTAPITQRPDQRRLSRCSGRRLTLA